MADDNGAFDLSGAAPRTPVNLRVAESPYPHLRDDSGCILARDCMHAPTMAFVLLAVQEKIERDSGTPAGRYIS